MYIGCVLFNVPPLLNNILYGAFHNNGYSPTNGTIPAYEFSMNLYYPFTITNVEYVLIAIFNILITSDGAYIFCTFDILMSIIIFHVWGHLKILKYHLENFPKPAMEVSGIGNHNTKPLMYSKEELQNVFEILKENIEHHKLIMV